jgi:hypothetical protein
VSEAFKAYICVLGRRSKLRKVYTHFNTLHFKLAQVPFYNLIHIISFLSTLQGISPKSFKNKYHDTKSKLIIYSVLQSLDLFEVNL